MTRLSKFLSSPLCIYLGFPLIIGLISLHRGQDSNFDLLNYHYYNPSAWLYGRIGRDLAAAGLQSYFNPLLDVPYYVLSQAWPAPLLGFLLGAFQGLSGVLVYLIARRVFPESTRSHVWLAIAGVLTADFYTEIGNTMGDNNTAPFVLAGVLSTVLAYTRKTPGQARLPWLLLGGVCVGAAVGLKLTNAPYAVALGAAVLMTWPRSWLARVGAAAVVAIGSAAGFLALGAYWLWRMWSQFGNPLFPQFGRMFPNPIASAGGISDASWLPRHWWEYLVWPVLTSLQPLRVGQLHLHSSIWPVFYVLLIAAVIARIATKRRAAVPGRAPAVGAENDGSAWLIVWFTAIGFSLWMLVFSIARYLTPIDLLAPMASWILFGAFHLKGRWKQAAVIVLAMSSVFTLTGPRHIWDHRHWGKHAFAVTTPILADPEHTLIFMGSSTPQAWMIPFFPAPVTFVEVGGAFPQGPAFIGHVKHMLEAATHVYVLRDPHPNPWYKAGEDAKLAGLSAVGVRLDTDKCQSYPAAIGREDVPYQLCPATKTGE
jgi:hypothetical protein